MEVDTTPRRPAHVELQLRLLRPDGVVGLERSYAFPDGDCGSAADLVAAAVDRFLSTFPQWAEPEPPAPAVPEAWIEGTARGGLHALVAPLGAGAEMSFDLSYGRATNRIGGGVVALGSLPMRVGTGRFALSGLLAEASWTSQWSDVEVRAGLRGGGVLVWGMSFDDNESALLPWGEAALGLSRELAWGSVGVQAAASPWRHRAVTRGMTTHEQIPFVRVGLTVSVPLLGAK